MRIGLDFDNTIVSYDSLFHKVALEQSLVTPDVPRSKLAVRDCLRAAGKENEWIVLQGYVYGARMEEAEAYPGALGFIKLARDKGASVYIVSHKTKHPFMGPKYDLHAAARRWVELSLVENGCRLVETDKVFFELTKQEKLARIVDAACDYFIDDLPEILVMPGFPETTRRILFDPDGTHTPGDSCARLGSWDEIRAFFDAEWKASS